MKFFNFQFSIFKLVVYFVAFVVFILVGNKAYAAKIIVSDIMVGVGDEVIVPIKLDTEGETINAVSGRVRLSGNGASLFGVNEKNSFISFWLVRPKVASSELEFSGIVPGGFRGVIGPGVDSYGPGVVLNVVIRGKEIGSSRLAVDIETLVKHSELPTNINVKGESAIITVTTKAADNTPSVTTPDTVSPEIFEPLIVKSDLISDTGYALVFQTHDSDSGIDHYEVKVGNNEFVRAESPYPLEYSQINSILYVRAIDRAGNVREVVAGENLNDESLPYAIWGVLAGAILVLAIIYILWLRARLLKRRRY